MEGWRKGIRGDGERMRRVGMRVEEEVDEGGRESRLAGCMHSRRVKVEAKADRRESKMCV